MKIVVLLKQVPDTADERKLDLDTGLQDRDASDLVIDEINERALELALRSKDADKSTEVVVLSMGPDSASTSVRKALSIGADAGVHVVDDGLAGADAARTAAVLAAALKNVGFDVVIAGNEATDGRGGVVPAMIAEHLSLPLLGNLVSAELRADGVRAERQVSAGTQSISAPLPALLTVTESFEEARFPNFKGILSAKKKKITVLTLADLDVPAPSGRTTMVNTTERPARAAGVKLTDDGTSATALVEFLASNRLI